jgi:hypothetical protein
MMMVEVASLLGVMGIGCAFALCAPIAAFALLFKLFDLVSKL